MCTLKRLSITAFFGIFIGSICMPYIDAKRPDLPPSFTLIANNSKFAANFGLWVIRWSEHQTICHQNNMTLPSVDHIADLKALQFYSQLVNSSDPNNHRYAAFAINSVDSHNGLGFVNPVTKKPSFFTWSTGGMLGLANEPEDYKEVEDYMIMLIHPIRIRRRNKYRAFLVGNNVAYSTEIRARFPIVCQMKLEKEDFEDSKEERDYRDLQKKNLTVPFLKVGFTEFSEFMMSSKPVTWSEADSCKNINIVPDPQRKLDIPFKMFGAAEHTAWNEKIDLNGSLKYDNLDTLTNLRAIVGNHFRKIGVHPLSPFWHSNRYFQYFDSQREIAANVVLGKFDHVHYHPRSNISIHLLCYRTIDEIGECDCDSE